MAPKTSQILSEQADFVVVGSGAAGSAAARWLAASGASVMVLEEGQWPEPAGPDLRTALDKLYRDGGMAVAEGPDSIVLLQGRCVGGSTVVAMGVHSPMPEEAWQHWCALEPRWKTRLPFQELDQAREQMDELQSVIKTPTSLQGAAGQLMRQAFPGRADPTWRGVHACRGAGQCLLGCPNKAMGSADRSLLADAKQFGAQVLHGCKAQKVLIREGTAHGVEARLDDGRLAHVLARRAVFLCAGAIQSSWLLLRSGIRPTGHGFQLQPLMVLAGRSNLTTKAHAGSPVTSHALRPFGAELFASVLPERARGSYLPGIGLELEERLQHIADIATWNLVIRPTARGEVRDRFGRPQLHYGLTPDDRQRCLLALSAACEGMLRGGASEVYPQLRRGPPVVSSAGDLERLRAVPSEPAQLPLRAIHFFGGLHVDDRFQVPGVRGLVLGDSAAFPSAIGVGPLSAITAYATAVTQRWVA